MGIRQKLRHWTYSDVDKLLTGRCARQRKVANNTWLYRDKDYYNQDQEYIALKLHYTDIVWWYPNGNVSIFMAGWNTITTRQRINACLPFGYYAGNQYNGTFLFGLNYSYYFNNLDCWHFRDGITITRRGTVKDGKPFLSTSQQETAKQLRTLVETIPYNMQLPQHTDCWFCYILNEKNQPLGDVVRNKTHIKEHVNSGVLSSSLVRNALLYRHASDNLRILAEWQREEFFSKAMWSYGAIKRTVYSYLCTKLDIPLMH